MSGRGAILIVDDEAIIVMSLKHELASRYGDEFLLETALSAGEADALIDELAGEGVRLILIISDWLMPGVKGDEFLAAVKARHPRVRCIILSGHADEADIAALRGRLALDAFIRKPWTRVELIAAVDACVSAAIG